jgi:hypothetical protein
MPLGQVSKVLVNQLGPPLAAEVAGHLPAGVLDLPAASATVTAASGGCSSAWFACADEVVYVASLELYGPQQNEATLPAQAHTCSEAAWGSVSPFDISKHAGCGDCAIAIACTCAGSKGAMQCYVKLV